MSINFEVGKTYIRRDGQKAKLICILDSKCEYPFVFVNECNTVSFDTRISGRCQVGNNPCNADIVAEYNPLHDLKIDDKVLVSDGGPWYRRHFAGISDSGNILVFTNGRTSFSAKEEPIGWRHWEHWKLPEQGE
jgi:hypothetical protein